MLDEILYICQRDGPERQNFLPLISYGKQLKSKTPVGGSGGTIKCLTSLNAQLQISLTNFERIEGSCERILKSGEHSSVPCKKITLHLADDLLQRLLFVALLPLAYL